MSPTARRLAGPVAAIGVLAAACGGSGASGPTNVSTSCAPNGPTIAIAAKDIAFHPDAVCAPTGQPLTVAFDNEDAGTPHNIQIFSDAGMTSSVFKGAIFSGSRTMRYDIGTLPAGVYHFRCDVHPSQMQGELVVSG